MINHDTITCQPACHGGAGRRIQTILALCDRASLFLQSIYLSSYFLFKTSCRLLKNAHLRRCPHLSLKEEQDLGNAYAREWLRYAVKRLQTESARKMAQEILETDSTEWWFEKKTEWWVNGPQNNQSGD